MYARKITSTRRACTSPSVNICSRTNSHSRAYCQSCSGNSLRLGDECDRLCRAISSCSVTLVECDVFRWFSCINPNTDVRWFVGLCYESLRGSAGSFFSISHYANRACKWVTIHGVTPRDWSLLGTKRD